MNIRIFKKLGRLTAALSSPIDGDVLLGPNWFASVMGTGIVSISAATLPIPLPGLFGIATIAWILSCLLLGGMLLIIPAHWLLRPGKFTALLEDPIAIQFFGAPPMALMTVGTATMLIGAHYIGDPAAVALDSALWIIGTLLGLITAVLVPYRLFTQIDVRSDGAFGGWLMPVVPPMVSAATGALLIPHVSTGDLRETLLFLCYSMFGMSLIVALIITTLIWSRLVHFGSSGSTRVPTLWIVLGPLGQSITAVGSLATVAAYAVAEPLADGLKVFAVVYGVSTWGFIWLWLPIAALLTWRARRKQMKFALTWWSFTFPIGTCVTGTSQLAKQTGAVLFQWCAVGFFLVLLIAWFVVLFRTATESVDGALLTPGINRSSPHAFKDLA